MGLSFGLGPAADRKEAIQVIRSAVRDFDRNATAITSRSLIFARLLDVMDVGYVLLRSRCSPWSHHQETIPPSSIQLSGLQ
jgi:hypothetical protein